MIGGIKNFRFWCQKVLPLVYDNSLSYYEILCKVVHYLNHVIDDMNQIPDYIDEKVKESLDDEHIKELISEVFRTLEDAISNNNEEENTNFSKDYPKLGTLLWHDNKLYETIRVIDQGDTIIPDVNIKLVNFGDMFNDFIDEVKKNFTEYDDVKRETSSMDRPVHQLVWLDDVLYEVSKPINEGNAYIYEGDNTNVVPITMDGLYQYILDLIAQEILNRETADGVLQDNIDAEALTREQEDTRIELEMSDLITSKISIVEGELAEEAQIRLETDELLSSRLGVEIADREEAVRLLQEYLNAEEDARIAGDNALSTRINNIEKAEYKNNYQNVKALGAKGDGSLHPLTEFYGSLDEARVDYPFANTLNMSIDTAAIQKAVNYGLCFIPAGNYQINMPIELPQGISVSIIGEFRRSTFLTAVVNNIHVFNFERINGPSVFDVSNITVRSAENISGVTAIYFHGLIDGATRYEDNWLTCTNCHFYDLNRAFDLYCCSNIYIDHCYAVRVQIFGYLGRAASFAHFSHILTLLGYATIYCDDTLADGISNGLYLYDVIGVFNTNLTFRIVGWQAVYIQNCSADFQGGTDGGYFIYECQDVTINGCWCAGTDVANSFGIRIWTSYNVHLSDNTIEHFTTGIRVDAVAYCGVTISNNVFITNSLLDVQIDGGSGVIVTGNTFRSAGNFAPVKGYSSTNYNIASNNVMIGTSYDMTLGANSVTTPNIFI